MASVECSESPQPYANVLISWTDKAKKMMDVILYTRSGCHLCDEAHQLLLEQGLHPKLVDIDTDQKLREQFNTCVPVVEIDGKVRFRGKVEPVLLKRLLQARKN